MCYEQGQREGKPRREGRREREKRHRENMCVCMYKLQLTIRLQKGDLKPFRHNTRKGLIEMHLERQAQRYAPFLAFGCCNRICEIISLKKGGGLFWFTGSRVSIYVCLALLVWGMWQGRWSLQRACAGAQSGSKRKRKGLGSEYHFKDMPL